MKGVLQIGDQKYSIVNSELWVYLPHLALCAYFETEADETYLFTEPILLKDPNTILGGNGVFEVKEIDDNDSTLQIKNELVDIWDQKVVFDKNSLFELGEIRLTAITGREESVSLESEISFKGFEIWEDWADEDWIQTVKKFLDNKRIGYQLITEPENVIRVRLI